MKTRRFLAFLCALLLALGAVSLASAEKAAFVSSSKRIDFGNDDYILKNGENVKFFCSSSPYSLYSEDGYYYTNLDFDCNSKVKGTVVSGSSWLTVSNTVKDCIIRIADNETAKSRTGKITFKGTNYSATIRITQRGKDTITSAKRSKKTVTLKLKYSSGAPAHYLHVSAYSLNSEGVRDYDDYHYMRIYSDTVTGSTYKFTVKKGYVYFFDLGPAIYKKDGSYSWSSTSGGSITVTKVTGTQAADYIY